MCLILPAPRLFAMLRAAEVSVYSWHAVPSDAALHSIDLDLTPSISMASLLSAINTASAELKVTESFVLLQLLMRCVPNWISPPLVLLPAVLQPAQSLSLQPDRALPSYYYS